MKIWVWAVIGTFAILSSCSDEDSSSLTLETSSPIMEAAVALEYDTSVSYIDMAIDKYSNIYFLKSDSTDIDNGIFGTQYSLIKSNSSGEKQFIITGGGSNESSISAKAIATDDLGNIIVTGEIYSGKGNLDVAEIPDMYLAKYDEWGHKQFELLPGEEGSDSGRGIDTDGSGNIYIAEGTVVNFDGTEELEVDRFLVKYGANGDKAWSVQVTDVNWWGPLTVNSSGDIYILGNDAISKYNSSGVKQWTQSETELSLAKIVVDESGNLFAAGIGDDNEVELAKYDSSGNKIWSKKLGWKLELYYIDLVLLTNGDFIIGGSTFNHLDGTPKDYPQDSDIIIAKYNSDGNQIWLKLLGTSYYETFQHLGADKAGFIYINAWLSEYKNAALCLIKLNPSGDQIDLNADASNDI